MNKPLISITTDFGVQSQGVGIMEAVAFQLAPHAKYINLMHGLPSYNLTSAARTLETVLFLPIGYHICVVDPEVGSARNPIVLKVARGDFLVGPDNGVLIPASRILGGITQCNIIENEDYMLHPVSPIFHGRDIFVPAAAHLANGIKPDDLGQRYNINRLVPAPYEEAYIQKSALYIKVIHVNHYGSIILNIMQKDWDNFNYKIGITIDLMTSTGDSIPVKYGRTFAEVPIGADVLIKDDYGRIEVATNLGNFSEKHKVFLGDEIKISVI